MEEKVANAFEIALNYHRQNNLPEARKYYEMILSWEADEPNALFLLGRISIEEGESNKAVKLIEKAIARSANPQPYYSALAVALQNTNDNNRAEQACMAALEFDPSDVTALNTLGNVYGAKGKFLEAENKFREALEIQPDVPDIFFNLGNVLKEQGKFEEASHCFGAAIKLGFTSAEVFYSLGNVFFEIGKSGEAKHCYSTAVKLKPDFEDAYFMLGVLSHKLRQPEDSISAFQKCIAINPVNEKAHKNLAASFYESGCYEEARKHYESAYKIHPTDGVRVILSTLLPPIVTSSEEIDVLLRRFEKNLDALISDNLTILDPLGEVGNPRFFHLAYYGREDRHLMEKLARFYGRFLPKNCIQSQMKSGRGRIRVGFISRFFVAHSVSFFFSPIIESLARLPEFDVVLLSIGDEEDEVLIRASSSCSNHVLIPLDLNKAREIVSAQNLDVLFYTDIGMEPLTYYLAFTRLAPVQCVTVGHLVTTGIPAMDYYISSKLIEPEGGQRHYSEKLIQLESMPCLVPFPQSIGDIPPRKDLGLSENTNIYVCPMRLHKIHPDFDFAIGEILRQDPKAEIVLFKEREKRSKWHALLRERLMKNVSENIERIRFVDWAEPKRFLQIIHNADVILDSFHYGGGVTAYHVLSTGTPLVTWPGSLMRGRMTYGCLKKIQLDECIASSPEDYVKIAVELAQDKVYQDSIRQKILSNNRLLYDDFDVVDEIASFFKGQIVTKK